MPWIVRFDDEFEQEFLALRQDVQDNLLAADKRYTAHLARLKKAIAKRG
jgi:hypothetical protein